MGIVHVKAFNIEEAWWRTLRECVKYGRDYEVKQGSFAGHIRRSMDFAIIEIERPTSRPLFAPTLPGEAAPPTNDIEINSYFRKYIWGSEVAEDEIYTYGSRIAISRDKIIQTLMEAQEGTAHCIFQVAEPADAFLKHRPCLRHIDSKIVVDPETGEKELWFYPYFRSWDLWGGLPENLGGIALFQESVAAVADVKVGPMIATSKDLHIYDMAFKFVEDTMYIDSIKDRAKLIAMDDTSIKAINAELARCGKLK